MPYIYMESHENKLLSFTNSWGWKSSLRCHIHLPEKGETAVLCNQAFPNNSSNNHEKEPVLPTQTPASMKLFSTQERKRHRDWQEQERFLLTGSYAFFIILSTNKCLVPASARTQSLSAYLPIKNFILHITSPV